MRWIAGVSTAATLEYIDATGKKVSGPLTVTTTQSGQTLTWALGNFQAGQQAVITLTARVANNDQANAGTSVTNTASYTYTNIPAGSVTSGSSGPLMIVEPSVAIAKSVNPTSPPSAGDTLHYTVTLTVPEEPGTGTETVSETTRILPPSREGRSRRGIGWVH